MLCPFILLLSSTLALSVTTNLIIDTDIGFDVDDAGAIAIAQALSSQLGSVKLLGMLHNTGFVKGVGAVSTINQYYHNPVALGAYTGQWGSSDAAQLAQDSYTTSLINDYNPPIKCYTDCPSATKVYTSILRAADNNTVTIVSIGELGNLRDIISAEQELFKSKVKEVIYMDGGYNFGCGDSKGSGISPWLGSTKDCYGSAQYVVENIPSTIKQVFSLNGGDVYTGSRFNDGCGDGPVKQAYQTYTNHGSRPSWDLIAVYLAINGYDSLYSKLTPVTTMVDFVGSETYNTSDTSHNMFQVWVDEGKLGDVTRILDDLICAAPCRGDCARYALHSMKNC